MPLDEELRLHLGFERMHFQHDPLHAGRALHAPDHRREDSFYRQQGEKRDYRAFSSLTAKNIYQIAIASLDLCFADPSLGVQRHERHQAGV